MEIRKNTDIVKLLFRMKSVKKAIINTSQHIKGIKVLKDSTENYNRCFSIYQEASCYFFQCCGFLKSQYFGESISPSSRKFLVTKLYIPSYKKFIELRQNLSLLKVDDIYETSLQMLKKNVEGINNSLSTLLNEINRV